MENNKDKNYYEILEVPINATDTEVQQGYLRAKSAYGSESLALYSLVSEEECSEILGKIEEAYNILSDPIKRGRYDHIRGLKVPEPEEEEQEAPTPSQTMVQETEETAISMAQDKQAMELKSSGTRSNITKLVASKRFALDYEKDPLFEEEIEQATEFPGEFLKRIREYKGVDSVRMADMTKVSKTYLANIEEENLDNLPALVYVRGFIFQYAKCLKLNPEMVANSYIAIIKQKKSEAEQS